MTDFPAPTQSDHTVNTPLGQLHVVARGRGDQTMVLWPSIFTDHHIYDALTDHLADRFRFLLIDGPGHGKSAGPEQEFSMQTCGQAMLAVLDHFGLDRAVIGGTSWGGLAAAEMALAAPARVSALVLMNTPMQIDGARPGLSARLIAAGARWAGNRAIFQNGVARSFFSDSALSANPDYRRQFQAMLSAADLNRLATAIRSVILRGTPLKGRMARLTVPVLVVAGKDDGMYPIEDQAEAAVLAPQGHFEPIDGKHISVVEHPDEVAARLERFLATAAPQ